MTATTLLDGAATKRAGRHLQPVRYVARWWDGTEYVPCLVVRTPRGRRRVVQLDSKVVVVTGRGRAARRALRKARASVSPAALPTRPVTAQVARITQDVDVRTCPWPGCGHLAVIPAPGLGGAGAFACGHDS